DCLLPCNLCCRGGCGGCGGGCGLLHGCMLGGRTWGHCSMCCGGPVGGYGPGAFGGGCGGNPCGSAYAPSVGGHCTGCSSVVPGAGDSIIEGPMLPTPSAAPSPEVRRGSTYRTQPTRYQAPPASDGSKQSVLRRA